MKLVIEIKEKIMSESEEILWLIKSIRKARYEWKEKGMIHIKKKYTLLLREKIAEFRKKKPSLAESES